MTKLTRPDRIALLLGVLALLCGTYNWLSGWAALAVAGLCAIFVVVTK
jgi:hypothetical protein